MDEPTPPGNTETDRETASAIALEILDELTVRLLECRLVLEALHDEVGLNFDEFIGDISVVERSAQEAFGAASLLNKGVALDERWGYNLSRPKAIFGRHRAAARRGAPAVSPEPSTVDVFNLGFRPLTRLDRIQDMSGPRPTCETAQRVTGPAAGVRPYIWELESSDRTATSTPHAPNVTSTGSTRKRSPPRS